jgi:hypothetical protein
MKRSTLITTTLVAGIFTLGMTSQASAEVSTQARFEAGGIALALGGTREGIRQYSTSRQAGVDEAEYGTTYAAGSPTLGGTREGFHRERIKIESHQAVPESMSRLDYAGLNVGNTTLGTRN